MEQKAKKKTEIVPDPDFKKVLVTLCVCVCALRSSFLSICQMIFSGVSLSFIPDDDDDCFR